MVRYTYIVAFDFYWYCANSPIGRFYAVVNPYTLYSFMRSSIMQEWNRTVRLA